VSDGTRTRDRLDHNQELYQLSYAHQGSGPEGPAEQGYCRVTPVVSRRTPPGSDEA
jgi:hypothetical protein